MGKFRRFTRVFVHAIEIKRQRIEELELFVILKQVFFLDPARRHRVLSEFILEVLLALQFAIKERCKRR